MTFVGFVTRADLTKLGTYLLVGLIGVIVAMLLNFFLRSSALDLVVSLVGVVIFTGLTAYDTQKLSRWRTLSCNSEGDAQASISALLTLCCGLHQPIPALLRLMGRRRKSGRVASGRGRWKQVS
jgi:FtsH-binding integral membrane protein